MADCQFRIQLSSGDPCHCVTLGSATDIFGLAIKQEWDRDNFWCSNNFVHLKLTAELTFYSKRLHALFSLEGILGITTIDENTCHTEESINEDQSEGVNIIMS